VSIFFLENPAVCVEKCRRAGQATDDNMAHGHYMLETQGYRYPLRICNNYCRAGQATDDNMAHGHYMLETQGYRYPLRICNNYSFSTATVIT